MLKCGLETVLLSLERDRWERWYLFCKEGGSCFCGVFLGKGRRVGEFEAGVFFLIGFVRVVFGDRDVFGKRF